ncbi:hypothetical protein WS63_06885 [Burkholderia stagnalis]|uniref:DUF3857 domain-containing transglutaminase family protein n=1 Tax=Burkholderia stagnalis TaxID=1503054 RepID=UPI00075D3870|nr:DUF3857 domain-containing transglutaminase family protein [Burkholderia stagnalis]KVD93248.1 hypothetical protein WS63_06885 [Burkholderia stagnalis]
MTYRSRPTRTRTGIAALLCVAAAGTNAALQPIDEAPVARRTELACRIQPDTSKDCTTVEHLTILRPAGRAQLSRLDFDFRDNDRLEIKDAAVIQPDGRRVALSGRQIDTRTAPNPEAGFHRNKQTSVAFPGLVVGSTITYTLVEHIAATPNATEFHERAVFDPTPVRLDAYRATFTADRPILWRGEQLDAFRVDTSRQGRRLVVELKAPRFVNLINEDGTLVRRVPRIELASSLDRQAHFGVFAARYDAILAAPLPPGAAAAVAAARTKPAPERVAALMKFISAHYRYMGDWRASERGLIPFDLAQIESNGYGDCKDLAVLLAAMLDASGIDARPALVFRGADARPLLVPGIGAPNHAIVRAVVDGKTWWLDPTNNVHLPGRTPSDLQDRWAFVFERDGTVSEDRVAAEAPLATFDGRYRARVLADGSARVDVSVVKNGNLLWSLMDADYAQGATAVDQHLCNGWLNEPVECRIERPASSEAGLGGYRIRAQGVDRRALDRTSSGYVYNGGAGWRDKWERLANYRRNGDVGDLYVGDQEETLADVRLDGVEAARPLAACAAHSPWFDVDVTPQAGGVKGIAFRQRVVQKARWLSHDDLNSDAFGRFLDDAQRCTNSLRQTVSIMAPA